ncbi:MAG TPA: guanylate kinase [Fodinibius sp.]|nr:guanylate kinase [Fodinibius sp.]
MNNLIQAKVLIIVAPSGAGKTTLARRLLADHPKIKFSVSATTRSPREGEKNGHDYYFLTDDEFDTKIQHNCFLEWEYYSGDRYGTLQSEVDKLVDNGYFPLLDIEVKGALNVQQIYGRDAISVFIKPPSMEVLAGRLQKRGSETKDSLAKRLQRAQEELTFADQFDYAVINDDLDTAYTELKAIIEPFITDQS